MFPSWKNIRENLQHFFDIMCCLHFWKIFWNLNLYSCSNVCVHNFVRAFPKNIHVLTFWTIFQTHKYFLKLCCNFRKCKYFLIYEPNLEIKSVLKFWTAFWKRDLFWKRKKKCNREKTMEKGTGSQSVYKIFLKFLRLLLLKVSGFTFSTKACCPSGCGQQFMF